MIDFKSMNRVFLVGRLTEDPEIKSVGRSRFARLKIATERGRVDQGENDELKYVSEPAFHHVEAWNGMAIKSEKLAKLDLICIEGHLANAEFNENGIKTIKTIIVAHSLVPLVTIEEESIAKLIDQK